MAQPINHAAIETAAKGLCDHMKQEAWPTCTVDIHRSLVDMHASSTACATAFPGDEATKALCVATSAHMLANLAARKKAQHPEFSEKRHLDPLKQ